MLDEKITVSSQVLALEEQRNFWKRKCKELEDSLQTKHSTIGKLKTLLEAEKFKSYLYEKIIRNNTDIKLDEIYSPKDDGLHISNFPDGNIPIIVHEYFGSSDKVSKHSISVKKKGHTGKICRAINKNEEEKPENQEQKIKQVEEEMEKMIQENNLDVSYKETITLLENLFQEVDKNRVYKKTLTQMRELRNKLLGKMSLEEYTKLLQSHIKRLTAIFSKKKYEPKKIVSNITISLSSLDQRLLFHGQYFTTTLDPDDSQRLKLSFQLNAKHAKRYITFSMTSLCEKICSYNLCVSSLRDIIKQVVINPYGFSNIVYLEVEKSTRDDPYSFYVLENINSEGGKRIWRMECRLAEFSQNLANQIKGYCINLFRRIYYDSFSDNTYRGDYIEKFPITRDDCQQLLANIRILCDHNRFCKMFQNLIKKFGTIQPSKMDKFNFIRDDPLIKKSFQEDKTSQDLLQTIKRLFDDISDEDAESITTSI